MAALSAALAAAAMLAAAAHLASALVLALAALLEARLGDTVLAARRVMARGLAFRMRIAVRGGHGLSLLHDWLALRLRDANVRLHLRPRLRSHLRLHLRLYPISHRPRQRRRRLGALHLRPMLPLAGDDVLVKALHVYRPMHDAHIPVAPVRCAVEKSVREEDRIG
jgi:hypothetical protein